MVTLNNYYSYPDKKQKIKAKTPQQAAKKIWRQYKYLQYISFFDENNVLYTLSSNDWISKTQSKFKSKPK